MILKKSSFVGFQCLMCGDIQRQDLDMFDIGKKAEFDIECSKCNRKYLTINKIPKNCYNISIPCMGCYTKHEYKVRFSAFWFSKLKEYRCPSTGELMLVTGDTKNVESVLDRNFQIIEDEYIPGEEDMGIIEDIGDIIDIIAHFRELSEEGMIHCNCGDSYIEMKLEPNYIIFTCPNCKSEKKFDISTIEKIQEIKSIHEVVLK